MAHSTPHDAATILAKITLFCCRRPWRVVLAGLALLALSVVVAESRLGLNSDIDSLFSASLPWKQRDIAFVRDFPQFQDPIVAVIDARIPEQADETAAALQAALEADHAHFRAVSRPGGDPFFERHGLLFLDQPDLEALLNRIIDAQPFLGQLTSDPSARGLFAAFSLMAVGVAHGHADLDAFAPALRTFHATLQETLNGHPRPLSWETMLAGKLAGLAGRYRFVLVQPVLDYNAVQPGGAATTSLWAAVARLPDIQNGAAYVQITGAVPLSDEEFATATKGALTGLLGSTAMVIVWLFLALRSWRLIVPVMLTLALGLGLTTGFAALAVGALNLISVAFAVLFVGIAVDFAIQFSVRFQDIEHRHPDALLALPLTSYRAGVQILVAAAAVAAGFLAFAPTSFLGVAQLGLVAGVGMAAAFTCTLTFLPACLLLCRARAAGMEGGLPGGRRADRIVTRLRWPVLVGFGLAAIAGVAALPHLRFDSDPLHTKDPNSPAMRTLASLMQDPRANPYTIDIVQPDQAQADALATRLRALPSVGDVTTLSSFIPTNQTAKQAMIADAASLLDATLAPRPPAAPVSAPELRMAAGAALGQVRSALAHEPSGAPLALIAGDLARLRAAPDLTLLAVNQALTRYLPLQLNRLRLMLGARAVTRTDLPPALIRAWRTPEGRVRVQVTPKPFHDVRALYRFVQAVQRIAPEAGGAAVTITATAGTIIAAFRHALTGAVLAIGMILALALRRVLDTTLVLASLLLSACLAALTLILLGMSLNFANIIALPLLLGVGVSFNIYFVMNWRAGAQSQGPLELPAARGVLASALTTGTAFSSLALSHHPGAASMGVLLLISLGCTLLVSLVFLPAVLAVLGAPGRERPGVLYRV